jgi:hypothetical protein
MTATNFDFAPPRHLVDGLDTVPIDIQHVTARLEFPSLIGGQIVAGLRLQAPPKTRACETFRLDVVERDEAGRVVGGVAVELRVREQS